MGLKTEFYAYLKSVAAVTSIVGTGNDARIYPEIAPQATTFPYLVWRRVDNEGEHHFGGASGLAHANIQIQVWAENPIDRESLSEAVREALDGYLNATWTAGGGSVGIRGIRLLSERDDFERPNDGSELPKFFTEMTFRLGYDRSVPTF